MEKKVQEEDEMRSEGPGCPVPFGETNLVGRRLLMKRMRLVTSLALWLVVPLLVFLLLMSLVTDSPLGSYLEVLRRMNEN